LIWWDLKQEFEKIAVEIWIALPVTRARRCRVTGKLASQGIESVEVILKTWSCTEEEKSSWISANCVGVCFSEIGRQPLGKGMGSRAVPRCEKQCQSVDEQPCDWYAHGESPSEDASTQSSQAAADKQVRAEFAFQGPYRRRHPGLDDVQPPGGVREAQVVRDGKEVLQMA